MKMKTLLNTVDHENLTFFMTVLNVLISLPLFLCLTKSINHSGQTRFMEDFINHSVHRVFQNFDELKRFCFNILDLILLHVLY